MSTTGEVSREGNASITPWTIFTGAHITLHAARNTPAVESAPYRLKQAEALAGALLKLLVPPAADKPVRIHLYLADEADIEAPDSDAGPPDDRNSAEEDVRQGVSVLQIPRSGLSDSAFARILARHYIERLFGADAASAPVFSEGIAGLAAANAGLTAGVLEADNWVRAQLDAGLPADPAARPDQAVAREGAPTPKSDSPEINPAAVSFVAFLISHSGSAALQQYLGAYDPARKDQAAITAYRRPLAVLQEEWASRLRRRGNERTMFQSFLRQIVPLLAPYKWKQIEILFYLLLAAGYNIVQPYAVKTVIDRLTREVGQRPTGAATGQVFMQVLAPFLLFLLGIYFLNGVVSLRRAYTVSWLNQNILNTLQIRMYAHLQRLAHNFYINAKIGDIMARLNDDLDTVQSALGQVTNKALYQSFTVVGALTALLMLTRKSPLLAIPILCIVPLFAVSYAALRTRNKQASREQRRGIGQNMATVQQNLTAHAVVKAFGLEQRTISDYEARVKSLQRSKLRLALLSALTDLSEDTTVALAQLVIFGVGGYLVLRDGGHGLGVGDLSALLVLVKSIFSPIASLAGIGQTMQQATGAMERVTELFDEPVTIQDKPKAITLEPLAREIRLENVTFRYGGERPALRDVSLAIPSGSQVALVGLSGGGKSSLVTLLMRFWDPEEGRVLFDGHDIRDVTLSSLRGQIGLVFQETFVFDTTLRENIAIGRSNATDVEIAAAARAAQLDGYIESLPRGYDTIPGENGARLSVGQKQRIAIARTFLRDPRILILDEATSALDAQTEASVLETLANLAKGRTTISVTHRIAQAVNADLILVMENGKLVEQGRHDELVKAGGLYKRLYEEASGAALKTRIEADAA